MGWGGDRALERDRGAYYMKGKREIKGGERERKGEREGGESKGGKRELQK